MKTIRRMNAAFLLALLLFQPSLAATGSPVRVLTSDRIGILENGRTIGYFRSEMPLPEDALMTCSGTCVAQGGLLQVTARDKTVFGLKEEADGWELTVSEGFVGFALGREAGTIAFQTPDGVLLGTVAASAGTSEEGFQECEECPRQARDEKTEGAGRGADGRAHEQPARGHVSVTDTGTVLAVTEGALHVHGPLGFALLHGGDSIHLIRGPHPADAETAEDLYIIQFGDCYVPAVKKTFCLLNYTCTVCMPCIPDCVCVPPWVYPLAAVPAIVWPAIEFIDDNEPEDVSPK